MLCLHVVNVIYKLSYITQAYMIFTVYTIRLFSFSVKTEYSARGFMPQKPPELIIII